MQYLVRLYLEPSALFVAIASVSYLLLFVSLWLLLSQFENYKQCKTFWMQVRFARRRQVKAFIS
jgi:hypothetical protein